MKKKLVAFAVTAAMVITSAVPALAWEIGGQPSIDLTKNEVIVTPAQSQGIVENINAAITEEGVKYETIVDFNRIKGLTTVTFDLSVDGEKVDDVVTFKAQLGGTETKVAFDGAGSWTTVKGIATLKWTIKDGEATVVIDELGDTARDEITLTKTIPEGFKYVKSVKVATTSGQFVIYQNEAPVDVQSVEVVECDPSTTEYKVVTGSDGKPVVATQPVAGKAYRVNSVTLDDGTVIGYDDLAKYVTVEWKAMKNGVDQITRTGGGSDLIYGGNGLMISDNKKFEGALVTVTVKGNKVSGIFDTVTWGADAEALATKDRIAGDDRYETAMAVVDAMKANENSKFNNFIVATGTNYADALSATALAKKLEAPILLVNAGYEDAVKAYIDENATSFTATNIYVIGGTDAVSQAFEDSLYKYGKGVTRLEGANRYQTNVAILEQYLAEGGTMKDVIVASGTNYPDALSAAATGNPILLVADALKPVQVNFLKALENGEIKGTTEKVGEFTVVGGTAAVSKATLNSLKSKDYIADTAEVTRLGGADRYATNKKIVEKYWRTSTGVYYNKIKNVYVATGTGYADALTGGALAAQKDTINGYGSPIVLVSDNNTKTAKQIVAGVKEASQFDRFIVIGGENAVSNELIQKIA